MSGGIYSIYGLASVMNRQFLSNSNFCCCCSWSQFYRLIQCIQSTYSTNSFHPYLRLFTCVYLLNYISGLKMKTKNRLNVLSSSNNKKRKFTIRKETILLQQSNNDLYRSETAMESDIPLIYRRLEFSWDCRELWFRHSIYSTEVEISRELDGSQR